MNAIEEAPYPQGPQPDADPTEGRFRRLATAAAAVFAVTAAASFGFQELARDRDVVEMAGRAALDAACVVLLATAALTFLWPERARHYGLPAIRNSDERENAAVSEAFGAAYCVGMAATIMYALLFHTDAIVLTIIMQAAFYISVILRNRTT